MRTTVILSLLLAAVAQGAVVNVDRCLKAKDACYNYATATDCNMLNECKEGLWSLPTNDSTLCLACKDEVGKLQDWIKSKTTEEAVEKDLITFCKAIPWKAASDECQQLVIEHFDQIYDDLIAMLDPDVVCTALHLCNAMDMDKKAEEMMLKLPDLAKKALLEGKLPMVAPFAYNLPGLEAEDDCSDCEAFMTDFKNTVMNSKKVVSDWMAMLKQECEALGATMEPLCKKDVNFLMYQMVASVEQNSADVKMACKAMHMCSMFQNKRAGDPCTDCKSFFSDWQQMLKTNPKLVNHVVDVVSQIYCLQKPPEQQEQCARYVAMVIKVLLDQVEREDVGEICQKLEFCQAQPVMQKHDLKKVAQSMARVVLQNLPPRKLRVKADHCDDCRAFIKDLQDVINNNDSIVQELVDLVKQECSELGPELEPTCKKFVDEVAPMIEDAITSNDVDVICTTIMMCSEVTRPSNGDLCSDCEAFFTDWQDIIANNKSVIDARLKILKEKTCEKVSVLFRLECYAYFDKAATMVMDAIENNCSTIVKEYLPQLWDLISETDPSEICATLYFCDFGRSRPSSGLSVQAVVRQATAVKKYEVAGDIECQTCQFVISEVEKLVQENATQEAIVSTLQKVCDLYGADIRDECMHFMETNVASIVDFVIQEVNSLELCAKIGLCKNGNRFKTIKPKRAKSPVLCEACELMVKEITKNLNVNRTVKEVTELVEKVCSVIPQEYRARCDDIVESYGAELIELLVKGATDPLLVCSALGLCFGAEAKVDIPTQIEAHFSPAKGKELANDLGCDLCKDLVTQVEALLMQNKTEDEIVDALLEVCGEFGKYKEECTQLVNDYTTEIIQLLLAEAKPEAVCDLVKLCTAGKVRVSNSIECDICEDVARELESLLTANSTEKEIIAALEKVCSALPTSDQAACKDLVDQYGPAMITLLVEEFAPGKLCKDLGLCPDETKDAPKASAAPEADEFCDVCKLVADQLDNMLMENSTEEEIEEALEKVCSLIPEFKDTCDSLIKEYGDEIMKLLIQEMAPGVICVQLKLCTDVKKVNADVGCDVCKFVAEELEGLLTENSTEAEIVHALEEVCKDIPSSLQKECDTLVEQYGDTIVQILVEEFNPSKICTAIDLCTAAANVAKKPRVNSSGECFICQLVMKKLKNLLDMQSTEEEIIKAVEEVCGLVPAQYNAECVQYIANYGPGVISILINDFNPDQVCQALRACQSKGPSQVKQVNADECALCKDFITVLDKMLEDNATQEELIAALEKVCASLPAEFEQECDNMVKQYAPEIFEYIDKIGDPNFVCEKLKLCPTSVKKPMLGVNPCTYGPSYWCDSMEKAKECNAISHCMNHVWE